MSNKNKESKKEMVTIIDPPSGWKYGFPRAVPKNVITPEDYRKWFIEVGYPEKDIELALKYSRSWNE